MPILPLKKRRTIHRIAKTAARGYGHAWQKYSKAWLNEHPYCAECENAGITELATVVDHIIPHRGNPELFWNPNNHQSMSAACHNAKTGRGE